MLSVYLFGAVVFLYTSCASEQREGASVFFTNRVNDLFVDNCFLLI